eukprot:8570377-Alexandrium_andersonii.AAC.1
MLQAHADHQARRRALEFRVHSGFKAACVVLDHLGALWEAFGKDCFPAHRGRKRGPCRRLLGALCRPPWIGL